MTNPFPLTLTDRFACILGGLCRMVAARGGRDHAAAPVALLVWSRLSRMVTRFKALVAQMEAGTLLSPRPRTSRRKPAAHAAPQELRLPSGHIWLIKFAPETVQFSGQVQHLLTDTEMMRLMAAAPQAGRIVRPLCRMLGLAVPEVARLPPGRARRAKPKPAAKRRPEPPEPSRRSIPGWPRPPTPFRTRVRKRRTGVSPQF